MSGMSREARALLDLARRTGQPSPGQEERVRAALLARLVAGGAGAGPSTAPPPAPIASSALGSLAAKVVVGVAIGAGARAIALAPADRPDYARAAIAPRTITITAALPTASVEDRVAPGEAVPVAPAGDSVAAPIAAAPPRRAASGSTGVSGSRATTAAPERDADIGREIAVLREAQQALRAGDPARAKAELDAFDAAHPGGALGEERSAARLMARCASEPSPAARAEADRFLAMHPTSPLAPRVRASCAAAR